MSDIYIDGIADFNATELHVAPMSQNGKLWMEFMFGKGAVEVTLKKSGADPLITAIENAGLSWADPDMAIN